MSKNCWCGGKIYRDEEDESRCADSSFHSPFATGRRDKITRLYIAGPMSGYPDSNYPAFHEAKKWLQAVGYGVVSPADFGAGDGLGHYVDLIRVDIQALLDCEGVATLEYWWESPGARNEVANAGLLKMPIRSVDEWLARAPQELGDRYLGNV